MVRVLTWAALLSWPLAAGAQPLAWTIDPEHSAAHFTVRHMVVSNVRGEFDGPTGTVVFDPADVAGTLRVHAVIDTRTIDTRNPARDGDLRSPNFFDVARFPTITFLSKRATATSAGQLTLIGDLSMHGVTREISLDVEGPTPAVKGLRGETRIGATATTTLDRRDFGLRYNEILEGGGAIVGNEVQIVIDIEMTRR